MDADITLTRSWELEVTEAAGNTEAGIDFVDGWTIEEMVVVDAGRIIVPADEGSVMELAAVMHGLTVERASPEREIG